LSHSLHRAMPSSHSLRLAAPPSLEYTPLTSPSGPC
jgi:hypothetical protein